MGARHFKQNPFLNMDIRAYDEPMARWCTSEIKGVVVKSVLNIKKIYKTVFLSCPLSSNLTRKTEMCEQEHISVC